MARGKRSGRGKGGPGGRQLAERVKTARGRPISSTRWLRRQLNDPYVARARAEGYRSRAAYKLIEIDERFHLFKPGARVIDLGAAPGGWTQVAVQRVRAGKAGGGHVLAVDITEMEPVPGADFLRLDFLDPDAEEKILAALDGPADIVLSDMAAPATGVARVDHLRIMGLCEAVLDFAGAVLAPGGAMVAKVLQGGGEAEFVRALKRAFGKVKHVKPPASRTHSAEMYVVAMGYRGGPVSGDAPD